MAGEGRTYLSEAGRWNAARRVIQATNTDIVSKYDRYQLQDRYRCLHNIMRDGTARIGCNA